MKLRKQRFVTDAEIDIRGLYRASDCASRASDCASRDSDCASGHEQPAAGQYPYTRGVQETMYRSRLWTMRQYAGFGTAAESNQRYHYLLAQGSKGLSVAFDLPTQMGRDSDHPLAAGEVGKVGVAIDSIEDMRVLFKDLPLETISTSMTINATAATLLCLYIAVADERGVARDALRGTIQNDILKEYIARGTYIYPPAASMRLVTDTFTFCQKHLPKWNTISISGYHIREAGADAVQEVAFTLANGITYVQAALAAGLDIDDFAPRLAFFFNVHNNFLEEVAKFRAARRMWATLMRERFGAKNPKSMRLRFHAQTAGVTLQAQQPLVNISRVTLQALAAVLGGTQSLHTNSYDEALGLPSADAARIALRTQQVIADESGIADFIDPLGGSYAVETLTDEIQHRAEKYIATIETMGGVVSAIEAKYIQKQIEHRAYEHQTAVESGERIVVGVNAYTDNPSNGRATQSPGPSAQTADPALQKQQIQSLQTLRAQRNQSKTSQTLSDIKATAQSTQNLIPPMLAAVKANATVGEIADTLRDVFGEYQPT